MLSGVNLRLIWLYEDTPIITGINIHIPKRFDIFKSNSLFEKKILIEWKIAKAILILL